MEPNDFFNKQWSTREEKVLGHMEYLRKLMGQDNEIDREIESVLPIMEDLKLINDANMAGMQKEIAVQATMTKIMIRLQQLGRMTNQDETHKRLLRIMEDIMAPFI